MNRQAKLYSKKARDYFNKDYNCAQSVILTMQEYYGSKRSSMIPKLATAFGAGIGRRGSLCGALTGGVMAIGLKHGTNGTDLDEKEKAYKIALEFFDKFVDEFESPFCRELTGYDLTVEAERERMRKAKVRDQKCSRFVAGSVELLIGIESKSRKSVRQQHSAR